MTYFQPGTFGIFPARLCKGMPSRDQTVMAWLCFHANMDDGTCFPSIETLAVECGMGRRTVEAALASLEAAGVVKREPRFKGKMQTTNLYRILQRPVMTGAQNPQGGAQDLRSGCAESAGRGSNICAQNYTTEHNQEQREEDDLNY